MAVRLSDEMREAVEAEQGLGLRVFDDKSDAGYVLVPEAIFERLSMLLNEDEYAGENRYPHMPKLIGRRGLGTIDEE